MAKVRGEEVHFSFDEARIKCREGWRVSAKLIYHDDKYVLFIILYKLTQMSAGQQGDHHTIGQSPTSFTV
jgi:hypothetical protein